MLRNWLVDTATETPRLRLGLLASTSRAYWSNDVNTAKRLAENTALGKKYIAVANNRVIIQALPALSEEIHL